MDKVKPDRKAPDLTDEAERNDFHKRLAIVSDEFALLFRMKEKLSALAESLSLDAVDTNERGESCSLTILGETYSLTTREADALLHELEGMRRQFMNDYKATLAEDMDAAVRSDFVEKFHTRAREVEMAGRRPVRAPVVASGVVLSPSIRHGIRPADDDLTRDFEAVLGSEIAGLTERGAAR